MVCDEWGWAADRVACCTVCGEGVFCRIKRIIVQTPANFLADLSNRLLAEAKSLFPHGRVDGGSVRVSYCNGRLLLPFPVRPPCRNRTPSHVPQNIERHTQVVSPGNRAAFGV